MKIVTIVGARPQFVKAAALSRCMAQEPFIQEVIVHTGQHFDINMSDIFFEEMQIPKPDYFLNINSLGHGAMTGQMLEKIEGVLKEEQPDWVLVYGDTNSTLAGALAARKLNIRLAHVEAGLRSFNMNMPEEVNRILTDRISDVLLCPTETAIQNLKSEGYDNFDCSVCRTGDIMEDAAMFYRQFSKKPEMELPEKFVLATVHRAENTASEERLKNIFDALDEISSDIPVVLPLHPGTRKRLESYGLSYHNITLIDPVGYLSMVWLLENCQLVMTDSGGLQKEAFFFKKPCITLRDETEWRELVDHGFNKLAGADKERIKMLFSESIHQKLNFDVNLYGQGTAGTSILEAIRTVDAAKLEQSVA